MIKREVKIKFRKELRENCWKIATKFNLRPKMFYKYINEKVEVTSVIRAV